MRFSFSRGVSVASVLLALVHNAIASSHLDELRLPSDFKPPQVFKHTNLLRSIDLTKTYVRHVIAAIVETTTEEPQKEYYLPIQRELAGAVSAIEARDKKGGMGEFTVTPVVFNPKSPVQYYRILFSQAIPKGKPLTLQITLSTTEPLVPDPSTATQNDKQFLSYTTSQYMLSAYDTAKEKTKLQFASDSIPDFTRIDNADPVRSGKVMTYGPYESLKAGDAGKPVTVRYEHTNPIIRAAKLERDIEVSHWGGNLATEERYWLENKGAKMTGQFSRALWAHTAYYNPATIAIRSLNFVTSPGAKDVYYRDDIGNVTTSKFRSNSKEYVLELKPRYPVFGGWNYSFNIGFNHDLNNFLREEKSGRFILKVPFLEGPTEPTVIEEATIRIILPEGAADVEYVAPLALAGREMTLHKTFMDTIGRTTIVLKVKNVVDEQRRTPLYVSYTLPSSMFYRKPVVFFSGFLAVFTAAFFIGKLDLRIK